MRTEADFAYFAAATLAMDLVKARPSLDEDVAADIAWQTFKEQEAPRSPQAQFQTERYGASVTRAMREIESGRRDRIEAGPGIKERALERLRKHIASTARNPDVR